MKLRQEGSHLLVEVSRLLLTHTFPRETTSGVQAFDKIIYGLEERDWSGLFLALLVVIATRL
jgi:hypothetical protein